ncbi:chemotaxis protein CheA [Photobacterium sp. TY1-4]|uniref:chemotaxis protein CheA n=1 Tax=Photobacterium sp. TY1-4 TaxID=2899122 RepID=UPI0021C22506|nr:chemotaxis protein CheA [Photobacterium sp. TY1-4]UXI03836.1 chemotaxis protein CheA [Photobacterium sp. TY1-4]
MALDMEHLRTVFYQECRENLEILENELLALDPDGEMDLEVVNTIFRAAHSIKGGGATFELYEISQFTHAMETLLDEAREGRRQLDRNSIDVLLQGGDCIRDMLDAYESNTEIAPALTVSVSAALTELLSSPPQTLAHVSPSVTSTDFTEEVAAPPDEVYLGEEWEIHFTPHREIFFSGNDPVRILRELQALDPTCRIKADTAAMPALEALEPELCYLRWVIRLSGRVSRQEIDLIFEWVADECDLDIRSVEAAEHMPLQGVDETTLDTKALDVKETLGTNGSFEIPPEMSSAQMPSVQTSQNRAAAATPRIGNSVSSIRVDIEKVDELINLVGELVITQSMLTELGQDFDTSKLDRLQAGLDLLLQNTKSLQESVLNIRMLPISFAFNRFPRLVRDLSAKLEKQVTLKISGEHTELDKTVLERITDPLVHLVRNAIDHGIEVPEVRQDKGKSETGTITLEAFHQGGSIVILVRDDGAGLDCDKLWRKAMEKSLVPSGSQRDDFTPNQIYHLIFAPGFSTAEQVSDISGRGVGMDVVKRNIEDLGGHIEVDSTLHHGSCFTISLPLTLAILDGQLVKVASQVFVIPLLTIIESVQMQPERLKVAAGGVELYQLREENVPIVRLDEVFGLGTSDGLHGRLLCLVEAGGSRIGLLLDELLGQQQVVIKSLENNYTKVDGISGATILGDGSVALILDVQGLITAHASGRTIAA